MTPIDQVQQDLLARMAQFQQMASQPVSPAQGTAPAGGFVAVLQQAVRAVDRQQHHATRLTTAVDSGQSDDLLGAMLESQKASIQFSALLQVRNKLTGAFDEVMKTPL